MCLMYPCVCSTMILNYTIPACTSVYEQQGGENSLKVMDDINTLKIPKHLCGYYEDSQGQ